MPSIIDNSPNKNYWGGQNNAVTYRAYNPFAKSTYVPPKKPQQVSPPAVQPQAVQPPTAVPTQPQRGIGAWFTDVYGGIKSWFNDIGSGSYKYVPPAVSRDWSGFGIPAPAASTYSPGTGWTTPSAPTVENPPPTQAGGYWRGTNANYSTAPTDNTLAQYSPRAMAGVPQNTFQYNRTYWSTGNQSHDPSFFRRAGQRLVADWQAAGGVNIPITDWFDPYDPAGSPYYQSQYQPVAESAGGYGGWGGWGGYGGGSYTPEDSAAFYSGNYTQRRNRWSETLLTWGLRQQ